MSFWGKLGHALLKVAPIATAFIPGVGPALSAIIGAGAGATDAATSGGGLKGALIGGLMGGATAGLGKAVTGTGTISKILGKTAVPVGSALASSAGVPVSGPTVGGSSMGVPDIPVTSGLPSFLGGPSDISVNASDPSFWQRLQSSGILGKLLSGNGMQDLGGALGAISQTQASNRGTKLDAMMEADKMKMAQQANQRQEDQFLFKMLRNADYVKNGGYTPKDNFSTSGFKLPTFDLGIAPISDTRKQAASTLEDQLMQRLNNPAQYHNYDSQMDPSASESILGYAAPVLSGIGNAQNNTVPPQPVPYRPQNFMTTSMPQAPQNAGTGH